MSFPSHHQPAVINNNRQFVYDWMEKVEIFAKSFCAPEKICMRLSSSVAKNSETFCVLSNNIIRAEKIFQNTAAGAAGKIVYISKLGGGGEMKYQKQINLLCFAEYKNRFAAACLPLVFQQPTWAESISLNAFGRNMNDGSEATFSWPFDDVFYCNGDVKEAQRFYWCDSTEKSCKTKLSAFILICTAISGKCQKVILHSEEWQGVNKLSTFPPFFRLKGWNFIIPLFSPFFFVARRRFELGK